MLSKPPFHRKMNEMAQGQAPRGPTISVMTSNKMGFPQHTPIYLVPQAQGQRPIQVQVLLIFVNLPILYLLIDL